MEPEETLSFLGGGPRRQSNRILGQERRSMKPAALFKPDKSGCQEGQLPMLNRPIQTLRVNQAEL